ncbi:pali-domain-containing protein [Roridomyces roridus]|uniref:Pali-domain-containing protein n=1 Tax=Roridomyces roridus TaxID=1738132 RepID=A0AAD7B8D1_9AGAR|nr:pali-domain-containing protein [Roridomyces roridus]
MHPRSFYFAALACLGVALLLGFITSISLPYLNGVDFVRVKYTAAISNFKVGDVRFGIWASCTFDYSGDRSCGPTHHGYSELIPGIDSDGNFKSVLIGASWTRGLAIHPVATVLTAIALGFALSRNWEHGPIMATLMSLLAAFVATLAFIVDIALYAFVKGQVDSVNDRAQITTVTSSAFWMSFVTLLLLIASGLAIFIDRRREAEDAYPALSRGSAGGIFARFRKN